MVSSHFGFPSTHAGRHPHMVRAPASLPASWLKRPGTPAPPPRVPAPAHVLQRLDHTAAHAPPSTSFPGLPTQRRDSQLSCFPHVSGITFYSFRLWGTSSVLPDLHTPSPTWALPWPWLHPVFQHTELEKPDLHVFLIKRN